MGNTTEFADKLQTAITDGNYFAKSYVWKGPKLRDATGATSQEVVNLMEATEKQLRKFYDHSISMLYNQDKKNPGRRPLLDIIQSQRDRCGVELYLRESEAEGTSRYTIIESIRKAIIFSGIKEEQLKTIVLSDLISVNSQFASLPIKLVQEGCLSRLGKFDKSHITLTFILKQGLRITQDEEKELTEEIEVLDHRTGKTNLVKRNYMDVVRERLNIADHMLKFFKMDPKGLNYTQLRAMLSLKNRYYNELNTEQLLTLRYRILFSLEDDVMFHIESWEDRLAQIKEVAELRAIELV